MLTKHYIIRLKFIIFYWHLSGDTTSMLCLIIVKELRRWFKINSISKTNTNFLTYTVYNFYNFILSKPLKERKAKGRGGDAKKVKEF